MTDTITTDPKHGYKKVLSTVYTPKIIIDMNIAPLQNM